ncbi:MobF family relaxase [Burkholderia glumae]|uniref:MobF family relaxase n=1 Tax=Burkholderia glumae TaxID=337 RepID=UPI00148E9E6B|nr:MobF family relaxase [Burkholderia glumae]QJW80019.1 relaxase domain-containing protein [Burkholderia glumae]
MLSLTKINSAKNQARSARSGDGYLFYIQSRSTRERSDFAEYLRGSPGLGHPAPFWAGDGARLLGLGDTPEPEHVERLAHGFHPLTGEPFVQGAGNAHVMGLDMTFSAPKDVSAAFAAADTQTQREIIKCLQNAARAALRYAESGALTRHEKGGRVQHEAGATLAACHTHFASRALDPQLHVHAFLLNVGKRKNSNEWSALELRPQFGRKLATGAVFRAELAWRMRELGFAVVPDGPYFNLAGISEGQRDALSTRSKQISEHLDKHATGDRGAAAKGLAALNTRAGKSEPPLPELLARFKAQAASMGLDATVVSRMRSHRAASVVAAAEPSRAVSDAPALEAAPLTDAPARRSAADAPRAGEPPLPQFSIDREELLEDLMSSKSCATRQEALAAICMRAMGQWSADECLAELDRLMASDLVARLGTTASMTEVFSSKTRQTLEATIDARVHAGKESRAHAIAPALIDNEFDALESELRSTLGVEVSLDQQRAAARHVACETGLHAFVVGWAGTGKTTMLRAATRAYAAAGFSVVGCCQSAAAARNLAKETGAKSRTVASLLLAARSGHAPLSERSIVVLDEAGLVGSPEFAALQEIVVAAGAKLVCVGDPKQLQPVAGGGIFASLLRGHGNAEISRIQRQKTDFGPLLEWLDGQARAGRGISKEQVAALRRAPEDARMAATERLCATAPKLARAFARWQERFDHEWLRDAVSGLASGAALPALRLLDQRGRLRILGVGVQPDAFAAERELARERAAAPGAGLIATPAMQALVESWAADNTPLAAKIMIAATRAEVASLNAMARDILVERGVVRDEAGVNLPVNIRDAESETKRFAPGDRIVFTKNDRELGVANGATGTVRAINARPSMDVAAPKSDAARSSLVGKRGGDLAVDLSNSVAIALSGNVAVDLVIELDDAIANSAANPTAAPNAQDKKRVVVPASFGWFDLSYCLTNHKSQGRTVDSAHVLVNPSTVDREWAYVAASRSRYATTLYVDAPAVTAFDPDSHLAASQSDRQGPPGREQIIEALARRMSKSRAKETTLDYRDAPSTERDSRSKSAPISTPPATQTSVPVATNSLENAKNPERRRQRASERAPRKAREARDAKSKALAPLPASPRARRRIRRPMGAKPTRRRDAGPELGDELSR